MCACVVAAPLLAAAEEVPLTDERMTVRTEANHNLLLPNDWPIEQKDGQLGPVPVEQYLSMKFGQVRAKTTSLDQRLAALEEHVRILETERQTLQIRVKTLEETAVSQGERHGQ